MPPIHEPAPMLLQIYRDFVVRGSEAAYRAIEEDAARICAERSFPHPHLALEPLAGPSEVWWLNGFDSEADRQRVTRDYESDPALVAALQDVGRRKQGLVGTPLDVLARYRADLSRGAPWAVAGTRFFTVTVTAQDPKVEGSAFEAPDGTRFVFRPAHTRRQAERAAAAAGPEALVFAVRPYWGMPAKEWIAADPRFWKPSPMASRGSRTSARPTA